MDVDSVARKFTGRRSVLHITRLTHLTEVAVARIIVQLLQQGYIEYIQG